MSFNIKRIRKSTRRVAKFVERNAKRPRADAVHNLRTSARHLETALVILGLDAERGVDSLLRHLKKTRKHAGTLRDMDVLTADALEIDRHGEQSCLVKLLEHLGAERAKGARKLRGMIAKKRPKILRALARGLEHVELVAKRARKEPRSADAVLGAAVRALQFSAQLSRPGRLTRNNFHEYRLKVKDMCEVLRLPDRPANPALLQKLGEVKDAIGDWHDWVELHDIAADVLDHGPSCELVKCIKTTGDSKYTHALSLTRTLITHHLRTKPRKSTKRSATKGSIATPVLEAAAAIAHEAEPETETAH